MLVLQGEDLMQQKHSEDIIPAVETTTAAEDLFSPEVVELSTLEPELNADADSSDWLTRLLRYDDENANDSNGGNS